MNFITLLFGFLLFLASCQKKVQVAINVERPKRTIINGKVRNALQHHSTVSITINRVGFGQEEIETKLDSSGRFKIYFESYIATDIWMNYQTNFLVLVHPGDSLDIEFDGSLSDRVEVLKTAEFNGDAKKSNDQAAAFQIRYYGSSLFKRWNLKERAIKQYDPIQFKKFEDSLQSARKKLCDVYARDFSPNLEVSKWATSFIDHDYYSDLAFYPESHRKALDLKEDWRVPISYYEFFDEFQPIENSLVSGYSVCGYTNKYLYINIRRSMLEAEKTLDVTNDKISDDATHRNFRDDKRKQLQDSIFLRLIINHSSDHLLNEISLTQFLNDLLSESDVATFEKYKELIKSNVHKSFLKEPLFRRYDKIKSKLEGVKLDYQKTQAILSSNALDLIKERNKGKAIYIDVWATWCGPCREEFPYSKKLQTKLGNDVVFVFLCIDSDETTYQNALKIINIHGQHYFFNSEQSRNFRKQLTIDGIPHYILVGKNGQILFQGNDLKPSDEKVLDKIKLLIKA